MILNKSKFLLMALVIALGGCSSLPSLTSEEVELESKAIESNAQLDNDAAVPAVLTPEQLEQQAFAQEVLALMGSVNTFTLEKEKQKKLNSSQLRSVKNAIQSLVDAEPDKALRELQVVIDDPDFIAAPNTEVWVLRGDIHRVKKQNEEAASDYRQALALAQGNFKAHNRLGLVYRDQGKFDLAKVHYNKAIEAWPGNPASYRNRGILLDLYVGDKAAALEDYKLYKGLLDIQIQSLEAPEKSLVREQKLADQWILDIERQIKALARGNANG